MPTQRNGQTYYTLEEVSQMLDESIEDEAQKLLKKLKKAKIENEQYSYV